MTSLLKWLAGLVAVLALLLIGALLYIHLASERIRYAKYDVPLRPFTIPSGGEVLEVGHRAAILHGCTGCHGENLEGNVFFDDPKVARIAGPNLTRLAKEYSDAELARLVRYGVKRDGTSVWIMPSSAHIADEELGPLLAWVRSVPPSDNEVPGIQLRLGARLGIVLGEFKSTAARVPSDAQPVAKVPTDPMDLGRYLVRSGCSECHGDRLQGSEIVKSPPLALISGYSREEFERLMRTGIAKGNRTLDKMTGVGRYRFSHLTDAEIDALYDYLQEFARRGGRELP